MVLDEIGRYVAPIVLSPPSFIPVFIFLLSTFPCGVSGFHNSLDIWLAVHHSITFLLLPT